MTIDAAGCQKDIAAQIVAKDADYVLALKDNQPTLHEQVSNYFDGNRRCDPKSGPAPPGLATSPPDDDPGGEVAPREDAGGDAGAHSGAPQGCFPERSRRRFHIGYVAAMQSLASSPHLTRLSLLRLVGCGVGDETCRVLCEAPSLAGLTTLDLRQNPISPAMKSRLRDRFGDGSPAAPIAPS